MTVSSLDLFRVSLSVTYKLHSHSLSVDKKKGIDGQKLKMFLNGDQMLDKGSLESFRRNIMNELGDKKKDAGEHRINYNQRFDRGGRNRDNFNRNSDWNRRNINARSFQERNRIMHRQEQ